MTAKKNTRVLCFANNKGGSGKSTTCANVGYSLAVLGKKVLLIDGDMQLNLSLSLFEEQEVLELAKGEQNLYAAIKKEDDLQAYILPTRYENLDLIPSSTLMSGIEFELFSKWQREQIFKNSLAGIRAAGSYDYILIDAPPTLGGWVLNILCASDEVLIPIEATPWGLFGLGNMLEFIDKVKKIAGQLTIGGLIITKVDLRKNYFKQTLAALTEQEELPVFTTYIRTDANIEWSQDNNQPVMAYKKSSRSAGEYLELARELLAREQ